MKINISATINFTLPRNFRTLNFYTVSSLYYPLWIIFTNLFWRLHRWLHKVPKRGNQFARTLVLTLKRHNGFSLQTLIQIILMTLSISSYCREHFQILEKSACINKHVWSISVATSLWPICELFYGMTEWNRCYNSICCIAAVAQWARAFAQKLEGWMFES